MQDDEEVYFSDVDESNLCCICFREMAYDDSHTLECDHRFHTECVIKWFRSKQDTCPLCRKQPVVRLKAPDVFHRAKALIEKERTNMTSDAFVRDKMQIISEAERVRGVHEQELLGHKDVYKRVTKPRKDDILREYRQLKKQFKDKSSPLLKELDRIDEQEHVERRRLRRAIQQQLKIKREAMRDIGMYNIEPQERRLSP